MTDPRERELEAALQREWDAETAAVYADLLGARGDPHGELIAIDLQLAERSNRALANGITNELLDRKRELIATWIGSDTIADRAWSPRNFEAGLLCGYQLPTLARHPLEAYVEQLFAAVGSRISELGVYGTNAELKKGLATLASRALPWLSKLSVRRVGGEQPIDNAIWRDLASATPNLRTLTLVGSGVVLSPIHPAVKKLRLDGPAVAIGREPISSVVEVDLRFETDVYRYTPVSNAETLAALVNPRAFPALRTLDLSWNAPPRRDPPDRALVLTFLDAVENLDRFERVRVPWVETVDTARELIAILERCPRLSIEIARMYSTLDIEHPRLRIPAPRAWPVRAHSRDALQVDVAAGVVCDELALSSLIEDLEANYDDMRPAEQQAWLALWKFLDELPWEDDQGNIIYKELPATTLLVALDALDGTNGRAESVANAIRSARRAPDAMVMISRYWGW